MIELIDGMSTNKYGMDYIDVSNVIYNMMGHEDGIKEIFYYKRDRLLASYPSYLILNDGNIVGFINLVYEGIDNIRFIDQAIIKKYRNQGIGRESLKKMKLEFYKAYIIGETKKNNILSNNSAKEIASIIYEKDDINYYLFQDRKEAFLNSLEYKELLKHVEKQKKHIK